MTVRRVEQKITRAGTGKVEAPPPSGIAPVLRASWRFARDTAHRFSKELINDRTEEFLKNLAKKFT